MYVREERINKQTNRQTNKPPSLQVQRNKQIKQIFIVNPIIYMKR